MASESWLDGTSGRVPSRRRRRLGRPACVVAATMIGALLVTATSIATSQWTSAAPSIVSATSMGHVCLADTSPGSLDRVFVTEPGGVIGADYQRAHPLPDGRTLWTFQDAAIRVPGEDEPRVVHNIAMIQQGTCFDVLYRGTRTDPRPFLFAGITIPYARWYWPLDAEIAADGNLRVFAVEMTEHGPDYLSEVEPTTTKVAVVDPDTLAVLDERPAPNDTAALYGWSLTSDHDWTYLYANCLRQFGYDDYSTIPAFDRSCAARITVGRVPRGELDRQPEYWDGGSWQPDPSRAAPVITTTDRRVNADQIVWTGARFLSVNKEGDWWGSTVYLSAATSATGPFEVYETLPADPVCGECNTFFANWVPRSATSTPATSRVIAWSNNRWDGEPSTSYRPTFGIVPEPRYLPADGEARVHVPDAVGADAVVLNVTTARNQTDGYLAAWPCDRPRPVVSNLNHRAGEVVAGLVVVRPDADGDVCVTSHAESDLVVDAAGVLASGSGLDGDAPVRLVDTRAGLGAPNGALPAGSTLRIEVPDASDRTAVALTFTAVLTSAPGFLTAYPCDRRRPLASNLNTAPGRTVANLVLVRPDAAGAVCLFTSSATHLVVDHSGGFRGTGTFVAVDAPERVADTRNGTGAPTGRIAAGGVLRVAVPRAAGAAAVALNMTVVGAAGPGFVTAYPCDQPTPTASNANFRDAETVANMAIVRPDPDGAVCVYTSAATHLVIDLEGVFDAAGAFVPRPAPERVVDSRIGLGTAG